MSKYFQPPGNSKMAHMTRARRRKVFAAANGRCHYCGVPVSEQGMPSGRDWLLLKNATMVLEHKTPTIRGGDNRAANIVCACRSCNGIKASFTVDEFRFICALKNGTFDFRFFGEPAAAVKRDWLICHTQAHERALVVHNMPGAALAYGMPRNTRERSKTWRPIGARR